MELLKPGIFRICIPFDNIFTSVFLLLEEKNILILDSGLNDADAETYIIPAVNALDGRVRYLVSSHLHFDHHGGIAALKRAFPGAVPALFSRAETESYHLTDGEILLNRFQVLNLKGHSEDALAVFDPKTNTLLSCDCLQFRGVKHYPALVSDTAAYLQTLEKIRNLAPETLIASHEYSPLGSIIPAARLSEGLQICRASVQSAS